ncbi:MAG: stage II sporulation protein R [Eubacteriales bacterium]|nr:stage II sporulation protein R [Eubacteriales bacterium]
MLSANRRLRRWESAALMALCLCLLAAVAAQRRAASVSRSLIRLHVLAVDDSAAEQAVKLAVRDAVLDCLSPRLAGAESAEEAGAILARELDAVRAAAQSRAGDRPVTVTLDDERYPTRDYEGFTLPAGRYRSLRIVLGEGKGHNWWCIVFPPVCLAAVQREALRPAMNPEDYALLTREEGWELRFRSVELWGELTNRLEQWRGRASQGPAPR